MMLSLLGNYGATSPTFLTKFILSHVYRPSIEVEGTVITKNSIISDANQLFPQAGL